MGGSRVGGAGAAYVQSDWQRCLAGRGTAQLWSVLCVSGFWPYQSRGDSARRGATQVADACGRSYSTAKFIFRLSLLVCCRRGKIDRKSTRLNSSHVVISYAV